MTKTAFDEPLPLSGHYRLIVALGHSIEQLDYELEISIAW